MSSRIFQNVVDQLAEASGYTLGVIDAEGTIISASDSSLCGERCAEAATAIAVTAFGKALTNAEEDI